MPAFAFDVGCFRLSLAEGTAILVVRNGAVAARVSALLRICHIKSSPELFDRGTDKAFQLFTTFRPAECGSTGAREFWSVVIRSEAGWSRSWRGSSSLWSGRRTSICGIRGLSRFERTRSWTKYDESEKVVW